MPNTITQRRNGSVVDMAIGTVLPANPAAPTVIELNAATMIRLECDVVGGETVDTPRTGTAIDVAGLCQLDSAEIAGMIQNGPITLSLYRHFGAPDLTWAAFDDTVSPAPAKAFWMCRAGATGALGAIAATDKVDLFTVTVMHRNPIGPRKGDAQRYEVALAVQAARFDVAAV
jgi:hypothetical protein